MKKNRTRELIILGVIFLVFNMLVFIIPFLRNSVFWTVYAFTILAIVAQIATFTFAFDKTKTLKSKFLSFPIFRLGYWYLFIQMGLCVKFMILSTFINVKTWIVVVPCVILLGLTLVSILAVDISREKISNIAVRQEDNTIFMRTLYADIKALSNRVSEESVKTKLFELSEKTKYSDYVSNSIVLEVEAEMKATFNEMKSKIRGGQYDIEPLIEELNNLLLERSEKCKVAKSTMENKCAFNEASQEGG
jgi:hypothetical protein